MQLLLVKFSLDSNKVGMDGKTYVFEFLIQLSKKYFCARIF